jgi:ectoine hydroxylase-related dioxygenase (phytanoyl-CoA dioxygenase family)
MAVKSSTPNHHVLHDTFQTKGYFVLKQYFTEQELVALRTVILKFHDAWQQDNREFYEQVAFNSSLITGSRYLDENDRLALFNFISSPKLMSLVNAVIETRPAFMNTQLFFNPINPNLTDFWHRDCQYDHDVEVQKRVIHETQVVHLRVPLFNELGIELVPGTHKRWDTEEEFNVRYEKNGRKSHEGLSQGKTIQLNTGDLLVFSADMLHRGLYGLDRLALDILVFDSRGDFVDYVDPDCLPTANMLKNITDPTLFLNTLRLKARAHK